MSKKPVGDSNELTSKKSSKSSNRLNYIVPKTCFQNPIIQKNADGEYAPIGYTKREIIPAEKAELLSVARAMNRTDFEPKLRSLFNAEVQAATRAIETGLYVGYRCPENTWDCIRVTDSHKCFCGHLLAEHEEYDGKKCMFKNVISEICV